ncbi:hypothetical protein [Parasphingorhabdus litoris]|nr:hypothetical protein [Parasphingorhabdus litoris]
MIQKHDAEAARPGTARDLFAINSVALIDLTVGEPATYVLGSPA